MLCFVDSVKHLKYYDSMLKKLFKSNSRIYLDYASLTPIDPRVAREVSKYSSGEFANPSSLYAEGVAAKKALAEARKKVADLIHAHPDEIVFTSGGTEANVLALEGVVRAARKAGIVKPHIIISTIEHSSIIETAIMLEKLGCEVSRISVDMTGVVSVDEVKKAIKGNTVLISIMTVNNETGVIQPIREIAKVVRQFKKVNTTQVQSLAAQYPLFHTDAAQAALHQELFVEKLGVDLMMLDAGKMYGPRGVGCLYIKRGTPIESVMQGGRQEAGMRSGTENIPGIMGFAKAVELAGIDLRLSLKSGLSHRFRNMMIDGLNKIRPDMSVNGEGAEVSPHILNVSIPGIDNEFFLFQLDARGVACSTKSSCLLAHRSFGEVGRDEDESYVLKEMGADSTTAVRFSFGRWTTVKDIRKALKIIEEILSK